MATPGGRSSTRRPQPDGRHVDRQPKILVLGKMRAVLETLAGDPTPAGPSELARRMNWNKSTAHRLLAAMQHAGLVDRSSDGRYTLGLWLMELGTIVGERLDLRRIADPALAELGQTTGQTVFLLVRHQCVATCIQRLSGPHVDVLRLRLGGTQSLHLGGGPRALLAGLSPELLEEYLSRAPFERMTRHTLAEAEQLRADVEETRRRGYALSLEDVTPGVGALGAPILDNRGTVVAAVSVAGLRADYEGARVRELASATLAAAERISRALGWTGTTAP